MTSTPDPGRRADAGSALRRALHDEAAQIAPADRWSEIESQIGGRQTGRWTRWAAPLTVAAAAGTIAVLVWTTTSTQAGPTDVGPAGTGTSTSAPAGPLEPTPDGGDAAPAPTALPPAIDGPTTTVPASPDPDNSGPDNGKPPAPSASEAPDDAPTAAQIPQGDPAEASMAAESTDTLGNPVPPVTGATAEAEVDADAGAAGPGWDTSEAAAPDGEVAGEMPDKTDGGEPYVTDGKAPRTIEDDGTVPQGRADEASSASAKSDATYTDKPTMTMPPGKDSVATDSVATGTVLLERYGSAKSKDCTNASCQYLRVVVKGFGDHPVTCHWDESTSVFGRQGDGVLETGWFFGMPGETVQISCRAGEVSGTGRITW